MLNHDIIYSRIYYFQTRGKGGKSDKICVIHLVNFLNTYSINFVNTNLNKKDSYLGINFFIDF